jgi:3-hydroxyisobutyrate dehydrogenase/glyoxylate/succinic semialdehyde reductase
MQKDLHLAALTAYEQGVALPMGNAAKETYALAARRGLAGLDFSAICRFLLEVAEGNA